MGPRGVLTIEFPHFRGSPFLPQSSGRCTLLCICLQERRKPKPVRAEAPRVFPFQDGSHVIEKRVSTSAPGAALTRSLALRPLARTSPPLLSAAAPPPPSPRSRSAPARSASRPARAASSALGGPPAAPRGGTRTPTAPAPAPRRRGGRVGERNGRRRFVRLAALLAAEEREREQQQP